MTQDANDALRTPPETFEEFLASSRVGYAYAARDGKIIRANARLATWLNTDAASLAGTNISDHFPIAGKVYFQTHLVPLLKMQGFFEEVALELAPPNAPRIPVLISGVERIDAAGTPQFMRLALIPSIARSQYERNIVSARTKAEGDLSQERSSAALREQFIAVLGHDLRNPLAAIEGAVRLLRKTPLSERAIAVTDMVHMSVGRMAALIDNLMDFARARLGGGIELHRTNSDLLPILTHVVEELRVGWPEREIETSFALPRPISCDTKRVAQLLSNLLANALTHGASDTPVWVRASENDGTFELSVSNQGEPIPPTALNRLFQPFTREDIRPSAQGLGLGLYIASQITKAHDGKLTVQSSDAETRFTLLIPQK